MKKKKWREDELVGRRRTFVAASEVFPSLLPLFCSEI